MNMKLCVMSPIPARRTLLTVALAGLVALGACTTPVVRQAQDLARAGQHEAAATLLQSAIAATPGDSSVRQAWFQQREMAVSQLAVQAEKARQAGRVDEVADVLRRMQVAAPEHPRTAALRDEVSRRQRQQRLMTEAQAAFDAQAPERAEAALRALLAEDPARSDARALLARIQSAREAQTRVQSTRALASATQPVTLEFRDAPLKNVFEALSRAAGLNFVFDKDVRSEAKVTLFLRQTLVDEALRVILSTQQLGAKLLNDNTVLVFPGTQQKQRDLLDTVTRSFYLVNADPKQAQTLIRTIAKTRDVFVDERLNMLVVRDTPEVMRIVERLVENLDVPDPEVMLELEVLEVSAKDVDQLGLSWPSTASYGVPDSVAAITSLTDLRWSTANPLALATLKATRGATNLLANPKIRARNREKAKILLGEKLPVFTTTSTANVGVTSSVSYIDVGLKLDIEPQVQLDGDVTMKVALEVSSVTDKTTRNDGSLAYQVGTRQASTTLRLRDGETQVLAGLLNDSESRSATGIPGLIDVPLLRHLFGTVSNTRDKTEVVLLVTPRVLRNIVQPASASALMPSGTEAQPGAVPLMLRQGDARGTTGRGGVPGAPAGQRDDPSGAASRGGVVAEPAQLSGPEEVMPGATFSVSVRNNGAVPLSANLLVDLSVVEPVGATKTGGLGVALQGQEQVTLTFKVREDVRQADTEIGLDLGGTPLKMRVRGGTVTPASAGPAVPQDDPADADHER